MEDLKIQNLNRSKAGLNKSFADSALGDLISKIETKCKDTDREFVKVAAHYTTVDCSNCGARIKKALSQRTHRCTECGYEDGRDSNAAKNILIKGQKEFKTVYRAWAWEHGETRKPDSDSNTECHQEAKTDLSEIAPGDEYSPPTTLTSPCILTDPSETSVTCHDRVTDNLPTKTKRKNTKKQRPSETSDESHTQLTLW
jgi:putative transposase